ncbi:hypothetical protein DSO57_1014485 [Entomophthora muscae]|uniref:Uncharacterized protein n=1 Tax=Entomophthora muscae TaxID=34485 RepID=A0ACC2TSS2_9FUNG|nr:hypothetical protein DSO57_1014485 [Entomophthora muscae]
MLSDIETGVASQKSRLQLDVMEISKCLAETNHQNAPISGAALYFVTWLKDFGVHTDRETQERFLKGLLKRKCASRAKIYFDLLAAGLISLDEATNCRSENEVALWRYIALSKLPSLIARLHENESFPEEECPIIASMKVINSFPCLRNAGGMFQNNTSFEMLDSKFQSLQLLKPTAFSLESKLFSLALGNFNIPDIKLFLESFSAKPENTYFQVLIYIIENNTVFQEHAVSACLDYLKFLSASRRYGDLGLVLANLLEHSKRLDIMLLYIPMSALLGLVEEFWQEGWIAQVQGESYQLFNVSVALTLHFLEKYQLHRSFHKLLTNPQAFPIHLRCLGHVIDLELDFTQVPLLGSSELNESLAKLSSPREAVGLFRTSLFKMIASGGFGEWLKSTAHAMFLPLVTSKFSFLAFEGLNILFAAVSDHWDLKAPAILFFKSLFSASLPQHYLRIFGSRCLSLAGSLDLPEAKELHAIVSHRHKPKEELGLLTRQDITSYLTSFLIGFQPTKSNLSLLDSFKVFSNCLETYGVHAFAVILVEEILLQSLHFSEAVGLGSAIISLPLANQEHATLSLLQTLWAEVFYELISCLPEEDYNSAFLLGQLAGTSLLISAASQLFPELREVSHNMLFHILTPEIRETYSGLCTLTSSAAFLEKTTALDPRTDYRKNNVNIVHLGFLAGFLYDSNLLLLYQS